MTKLLGIYEEFIVVAEEPVISRVYDIETIDNLDYIEETRGPEVYRQSSRSDITHPSSGRVHTVTNKQLEAELNKTMNIDQTKGVETIGNRPYIEATRSPEANAQKTECDPMHPAAGRLDSVITNLSLN